MLMKARGFKHSENQVQGEIMKKSPQLDNLIKVQQQINNNVKVLLDFFDSSLEKQWTSQQHLLVQKKVNGTISKPISVVWTTNIRTYINDQNHELPSGTYLMGDDNGDIVILRWSDRFNEFRWKIIGKMRYEPYDYDVKDYRMCIATFFKTNLVTQCLEQSRKLGNQRSNQNSAAQSARAKAPRTGLKVMIEFDNANGYKQEAKSILEAYRIIMAYNDNLLAKDKNKMGLKAFKKDVAAGKTLEFKCTSKNKKSPFTVYVSLLANGNHSPLNIYTDQKKEEILDFNLSTLHIKAGYGSHSSSEQAQKTQITKDSHTQIIEATDENGETVSQTIPTNTTEGKEYIKWCDGLTVEARITFDEFKS